jgi:hypothetical protein
MRWELHGQLGFFQGDTYTLQEDELQTFQPSNVYNCVRTSTAISGRDVSYYRASPRIRRQDE